MSKTGEWLVMPKHGVVKVESAYRNFSDLMGIAIEDMTEDQKAIALFNEAAMIGGWQEPAGQEAEMSEQDITITVKEYRRLLQSDYHLSFLEALGVDNWQGWAYPPDLDDYETIQEYDKAYQEALDSIY